MGNKSNMTIFVNEPSIYIGNTYPEMDITEYYGSIASPDYDSGFRTYAAQLYYNYKNNLPEMEECMLVYAFKLIDLSEKTRTIQLPIYI